VGNTAASWTIFLKWMEKNLERPGCQPSGETRLGNSVNRVDGLLAPSNIAMAFPKEGENTSSLTGVKITQALSQNFAVVLGKLNTLDEYVLHYDPKLGLRPGIGGYMNTSLVFNPILARTVNAAREGRLGGLPSWPTLPTY